jgi:hypothetical protein
MNNIAAFGNVIANLNQTVGSLSRGLADLDKSVKELDRKFQIFERMPQQQVPQAPIDVVKRDEFLNQTNDLKTLIIGLSNTVNNKIVMLEDYVSSNDRLPCLSAFTSTTPAVVPEPVVQEPVPEPTVLVQEPTVLIQEPVPEPAVPASIEDDIIIQTKASSKAKPASKKGKKAT